MRLLSSKFDPALLQISGAALTLLLTACSSNPLLEEPAPVAGAAKPAPQTAAPAPAAVPSAVPAPSAQAPAAQPAPAAAAPAPAAPVQAAAAAPAPAGGVETTQNRRFFGIFSPYRPDIQQGNFVSREMVAQLKEGMTPDQVRFVLGTPLLTDVFHAGRWDYPFRLQKGNGEVTSSRVTIFFNNGRLARIVGGDLPTEKDYLARLAGNAPEPKAPAADAAPAVPAADAKAAAPSPAAPK
jgi:outer membrane protein assembly factor BamE